MGIFGFGKRKENLPIQEKDTKEGVLDAQKKYVDSITGKTENEELMKEMLDPMPKPISYSEKADLIKCMSEEEADRFLEFFNCNREFSKEESKEFKKLLKKKERLDKKTQAIYAGMKEEDVNNFFKHIDDIDNFRKKESWELENGERAEAEKKIDELPKMERYLDSFLLKFGVMKDGLSENEASEYRELDIKNKEGNLTEEEKIKFENLSSKLSSKMKYKQFTEIGVPKNFVKEYFALKDKERTGQISDEERSELKRLEGRAYDYSRDVNEKLWEKGYEKFGISTDEMKKWHQLSERFLGPNRTAEQIQKFEKLEERLQHLDRIQKIEMER